MATPELVSALTLAAIRQRRAEIIDVALRHGASGVAVFGSVARGDSTGASDVDFLVHMAPGRSLLDLGALVMDLRDLLGVPVDVVTLKGLNGRVRARVLADLVPL
ncbi:MAG: nucleotidyltransferase family protein [Sporichthyaceae bacterium]